MRENNAEPVTLLVVHWNNPRACLETVRALREQHPNLQTVILDNASAREAYEELRGGTDAKIVRLSHNHGWGPALNIGLRKWLDQSRGEFCLISAHDAVPSAGCVELLLAAMERDARIGIACPQYADATVPCFSAMHGVKLYVDLAQSRGALQWVDVPHGTLFLLRRECLRAIGLFDERYFAYGDEHELGARARRHGWKVALVWGAVVANPETSTPSRWRSYLFARNSLLLVHDYFGGIATFLRASVIAINALRQRETARMRLRALRDYFRGRFGAPTFE
jgi:N-acetylglucosaminyl-diphospho-decaprenol L-rhamnosyltransferase